MSAKSNGSQYIERHTSDPSSSAPARREYDFQYERERVARRTDPEQILQSVRDDNRIVLALDLDQCSCIGEDSCDILNTIHKLSNGFTENKAGLVDVVMKIINPSLKPSFDTFRKRHLDPLIVIYTTKGSVVEKILQYCRSMRLFPKVLMNFDNLKFEMTDIFKTFKYISSQLKESLPEGQMLRPDIEASLDKIGIVSWAIALVLGLPYSPTVFVTNTDKNLEVISRGLNVPLDQIFLLDDKAEEYARKLGKFPVDAHMITVPRYNFSTLPLEHGIQLQTSLRKQFPMDERALGPAYVNMVNYTSKPGERAPFGMQSISRHPDGVLDWNLSHLSKMSVIDHEVGYPLCQIPDPILPQSFQPRYSGGRSFSDQ